MSIHIPRLCLKFAKFPDTTENFHTGQESIFWVSFTMVSSCRLLKHKIAITLSNRTNIYKNFYVLMYHIYSWNELHILQYILSKINETGTEIVSRHYIIKYGLASIVNVKKFKRQWYSKWIKSQTSNPRKWQSLLTNSVEI